MFVFSGGGLNGAAQAGMVGELLAAGVRPDAVVGVSAGALNAVFLASTPLAEAGAGLIAAWEDIATTGLFESGISKRMWAVLRRQSSVDPGTRLAALIARHCPVADLSECALPVQVGTLDLDAAAMHWWSAGAAGERLLASAAIPGMFPPVRLDGRWHVDGGTCSPVPLEAALRFRPTQLIVLDATRAGTVVAQAGPDIPGSALPGSLDDDDSPGSCGKTALTVLLDSFEACRHHVAAAERAMVPDEVPVVTIRAGIDGGLLPDTVQRIPEIVALGAAAARAVLAAHPELLGSCAGVPAYPTENGQAGTRNAPRLQELSHAVGRRLHTHRAPTARAPH